jgi:hypothetical protein
MMKKRRKARIKMNDEVFWLLASLETQNSEDKKIPV